MYTSKFVDYMLQLPGMLDRTSCAMKLLQEAADLLLMLQRAT
jgi:hypothetical protein